MKHRHIVIMAGVFALLMACFAWKYLPAEASNSWTTENPSLNTSQQASSINRSFLPLILNNYKYIGTGPLWRFGAALVRRPLTDYDSNGIASMRFGWYVDFGFNANPPTPYGMEYVQTVRLHQWKVAADGITPILCRPGSNYLIPYSYVVSPSLSQIQSTATSHPGMTWLIGNEMERVDYYYSDGISCGGQDEMLPELYAQAYHDLYTNIKGADPTAQVAIGGMVEFTDLRSQYLDRVLVEYTRLANENGWSVKKMPVDIWNIHLYTLPENQTGWGAGIPAGLSATSGAQYTYLDNKDFSIVWAQIVSLRTWMKNNGYQNTPLITTEYGVNFPAWIGCPAYPDTTACPFASDQVGNFMVTSFDTFLNSTDPSIGYPADGNRLLQRWNWWSIDYDAGYCQNGVYYESYGGSLFNSGLQPSDPLCTSPAKGITALGTYWKQYVQNLPAGSKKPYAP